MWPQVLLSAHLLDLLHGSPVFKASQSCYVNSQLVNLLPVEFLPFTASPITSTFMLKTLTFKYSGTPI